MKKILSSLLISLCFCLTIVGVGCSSCSNNRNEEGGQTQVEPITTLEGVWESRYDGKDAGEMIIVENTTIRCYKRIGRDRKLDWAGIYIPFSDPISEGSWTFENDESCMEDRGDYRPRKFTYSNGKLSCYMWDLTGNHRDIYFTKVEN